MNRAPRFSALLTLIGIQGHLSAEQRQDLVNAGWQAAPSGGAGAVASAFDWSMSGLLVIASLIYVALQAGYLIWKWRRDMRREDDRREDRKNGAAAPCTDTDVGGL